MCGIVQTLSPLSYYDPRTQAPDEVMTVPDTDDDKIASKSDGKTKEPILTAGQWLLLIATLLAAAVVGNLLK